MESEAAEASPDLSQHGFKGILSKARNKSKANDSKVSINGTDNSSDSHGIRSSIDSARDKLRASRTSSLDDSLPANNSSMSKLIPKRIQKKRKERKEAKQAAKQEETQARGRSISEQAATSAPQQRSHSTLGESLITSDSDVESPLDPPSLVSRPSHTGYLTSSSPLIKTSVVHDTSNSALSGSPTFQTPECHRASTVSAGSRKHSLPAGLAPQHATTMDPYKARSSYDGRETDATSEGRGISPGARIKDVFKSGSRKKTKSPPMSPDRESFVSNESGNTLGGLLTAEKRNAPNSDRGSDITGSLPEPTGIGRRTPISSTKDLPSITTRPRTPTSSGLDAPLTTVTPPTPTDQRGNGSNSPSKEQNLAYANSNIVVSASGNMISHRRARSESGTLPPSKLSNAISAPLTPTIEESRTPASRSPGTQGPSGNAGGFFSSVFTVAQNAANTLTSTISNNPQRPKSAPLLDEGAKDDLETSSVLVEGGKVPATDEKKPLAVETLGTGDLSLDHLGISPDRPPTSKSTTFPSLLNGSGGLELDGELVVRDEAMARAEDLQAARAVSAAYGEKVGASASTPIAEDASSGKPRSIYENSVLGDRTPPNGSAFEAEKTGRRSGSVRSRVGAVARRHRNSSSATGGTIGAGIAAGHAGLANPLANGSVPKLTGFAIASKKRNRDFHQLFRSVPDDDYLIEDYSCALQREIILAGRIYVSEGHICFSSNILGWVTMLVISFDEVVSIEKESTAMVFPNAIAIQTLQARHTFRSLLSREATYELLIGIWKLSHPNLKSSLNGARLDAGGTGDKTEKVEPIVSEDGSEVSEEEEIYDEDEEDEEDSGSVIHVADGNLATEDNGEPTPTGKQAVSRKASNIGTAIGSAAGGIPTQSDGKAGDKAAAVSAAASDFPGPATHPPTECGDSDTHYDKLLKDEIIPAPLGKVYSMMFGPASGGFISKWLMDEMKCTSLQMEDDKKGLTEEKPTRFYSYIKPLYASIGPKSTKCLSTENLDSLDLEKAVSVTISTETPDVPSGNVFSVKTRYCLMWAPGNSTRIIINCAVEWTGKSWLKGPIEKGANDGQTTYANDLIKALRIGVTARVRSGTVGSKLKKGKRRKADGDGAKLAVVETTQASIAQQQSVSWGIFEPLHGILGPIADIAAPLISSNMIIGFLVFLLLISWFRGPKARRADRQVSIPFMTGPERLVAYEEMWRAEESELWDWLEERIGISGIPYSTSNSHKPSAEETAKKSYASKSKGLKAKLAEVSMNEQEVDYAIAVTEEKLKALKAAVQKERKKQESGYDDRKKESNDNP